MLIDLHVHSDISPCSRLRLDDILALGPQRGLGGVCVTDHDTAVLRSVLREGEQPGGLLVLVGMEYATTQGDFLVFGPVDGLRPGLDAESMLARVEALGGAAVSAHPCRVLRPVDRSLLWRGLCRGVEVCNGRNSSLENHLAQSLPETHGLAATGGSDAHAPDELGRYATRFPGEIRSSEDLVHALRVGLCSPETIHPGKYSVPESLRAQSARL